MPRSGPAGGKTALARRLLLSEQGQKYVESTFARYAPESPPSSAPLTVLFDTKQLLLFRQDVQLLRTDTGASGTCWQLRVPTSLSASSGLLQAEPPREVRVSDEYSVLGDEAAIAGRLGLAPGQTSLDEALRQQGLRPLARWRYGKASFSAAADTAETLVTLDLETFQFDTKHAEPAAIAARLAVEESPPPLLGAVFAELRVTASGPEEVLDRFVRRHRLDEASGGARPRSTVVAEFLRLCRPAHFWELSREVGMKLEAPRGLLGVAALAGEPESDEDDTVYRI